MCDLPGRKNNLYKEPLAGTISGISEVNEIQNHILCREAVTAQDKGMEYCFGLNRQRPGYLIPARQIQYDLLVERALYPQLHHDKSQMPVSLLVLFSIGILFYLTKR
jgi:hypothetical protein